MDVLESSGFQVPLALDAEAALVSPERARRGGIYRCPQCQGVVTLHAGELRRRHFHHRATTEACGAESVTHFTAKELVVRAVEAWRAGGDAPVFVRSCGHPGCDRTIRQPMPAKVRAAETEVRLSSGRIVDVALLGPARLVIAAIEIRHTHAVEDEKLFDLGVPWVELDATAVCREEGRVLTAIRDKLRPWLCEDHRSSRRDVGTADRDAAIHRTAAVRALPFALEEFPEYSIAEIVRCPNGHDAIVWKWRGKLPPVATTAARRRPRTRGRSHLRRKGPSSAQGPAVPSRVREHVRDVCRRAAVISRGYFTQIFLHASIFAASTGTAGMFVGAVRCGGLSKSNISHGASAFASRLVIAGMVKRASMNRVIEV